MVWRFRSDPIHSFPFELFANVRNNHDEKLLKNDTSWVTLHNKNIRQMCSALSASDFHNRFAIDAR